jgi:hypothetical protein
VKNDSPTDKVMAPNYDNSLPITADARFFATRPDLATFAPALMG